MFEEVLAGVDFGPGGRDAVALACRLAGDGAAITLAHVYPGRFMPTHAVTPGLPEEERAGVEHGLEQERAAAGIQAGLLAAEAPSTGRGLHEVAEQQGSDLIVLGSCRRGAVGRVLLGDDTHAAVNGAPCAVAVAPAGFAEQPGELATIGVAYDGSAESEDALRTARALAGHSHGRVHALNVVTLPSYAYAGTVPAAFTDIEQLVSDADAEMKRLVGVEGRAEYGLPAEDLVAFSKHMDLLVVGSRGYGPWGRLLHGSTSSSLARHCRAPLLIVPRSAHRAGGRESAPLAAHAG